MFVHRLGRGCVSGLKCERQSKGITLLQNNNMPTCISYTVCVKNVRLLFGIPEPLNTYQNYTSQTLKTAHRILRRNWVHHRANAELQRRAEVDVLATVQRRTSTSTRRIYSMTIVQHVKTGPGAHPASYTVGIGSFPGVKRPGRDTDHPPPLAPRLKEE